MNNRKIILSLKRLLRNTNCIQKYTYNDIQYYEAKILKNNYSFQENKTYNISDLANAIILKQYKINEAFIIDWLKLREIISKCNVPFQEYIIDNHWFVQENSLEMTQYGFLVIKSFIEDDLATFR